MRNAIICSVIVLLLVSGCQSSKQVETERDVISEAEAAELESALPEQSTSFFAMDTYMTLRFWGGSDTLSDEAEALVRNMEESLSTTAEDSEIFHLNQNGSAELSEEAAYLLSRSMQLCDETEGALDISIYPIVRAWGFANPEGNYRVPAPEELQALLEYVDYSKIACSGNSVVLKPGMQIDLGAVTKGRLGDRLSALLRQNGVKSALLDLGGNIQTLGAKPDGTPWRIGIQDPAGESYLGVLAVTDCAVVTSGGYERYFIDDSGILRWHILNPADGYPAKNGVVSVTIVGTEGLYCDALSTGLFILGTDKAIAFWQAHRDFEMVLVTENNEILLTPLLAERFTPTENCDYSIEVISDAEN